MKIEFYDRETGAKAVKSEEGTGFYVDSEGDVYEFIMECHGDHVYKRHLSHRKDVFWVDWGEY